MLQLRMLSGEAVTSIPVEEIQDVKGLKQRLSDLHGLPPRFRQRVFFHGEPLKDDMTLDSPMNLDLVLLTFADVSQRQVDELAAAALQGSLSEVANLETVYSENLCKPQPTLRSIAGILVLLPLTSLGFRVQGLGFRDPT